METDSSYEFSGADARSALNVLNGNTESAYLDIEGNSAISFCPGAMWGMALSATSSLIILEI